MTLVAKAVRKHSALAYAVREQIVRGKCWCRVKVLALVMIPAARQEAKPLAFDFRNKAPIAGGTAQNSNLVQEFALEMIRVVVGPLRRHAHT